MSIEIPEARPQNDTIFEKLAELSGAIEREVENSVLARQTDYKIEPTLNNLLKFLTGISTSGKMAAAQWAVVSTKKDEPRGLLVTYILELVLNKQSRVDADQFILAIMKHHKAMDSKINQKDPLHVQKKRKEKTRERIRTNAQWAEDVRERICSLVGTPMPYDIYTRVTLFSDLSDKEALAAFLACAAEQDTDWVAMAYGEIQNVRAKSAQEDTKKIYTEKVRLSDVFQKALTIHMKNNAKENSTEIPADGSPLRPREAPKVSGVDTAGRNSGNMPPIVSEDD